LIANDILCIVLYIYLLCLLVVPIVA